MQPVKLVAILASLFWTGVAAAQPVFSESFENGSDRWATLDGNPIVIASDSGPACSTSYQHETISYGGRVVSNDIAVTGGNTYCFSAWMRASADATSYLGILTFDSSASQTGNYWLIGADDYNALGGREVATVSDDAWHWYSAEVTLPASTVTIELQDELWTATTGSADFDDIAVAAGPCEPAYYGVDQHQTCAADAMCGADGACVSTTPPGDMGGGGPSSSPDMGGVSVAPGSNTAVIPSTPSTPVAAEGTPSGAGAVNASGGGCSIGGHEGEESLGLMLVAFVAVMLAGRRRRA